MKETVFRLMADPVLCPGTYSLDAYCKYENPDHSFEEFPHSAHGQTERKAQRHLRSKGWRFHNDGTATCPKCVARLRLSPSPTLSAPQKGDGE